MNGDCPPTPKRFPTASERAAQRYSLTLWTDCPRLARAADEAGVDRIGPDFESLGKAQRQSSGYRISGHSRDCLPGLRASITHGELFARTEPVHNRSGIEVERLIDQGVDVLMVPMVRSAGEVALFVACVAGHARVVVLVEHIDALNALDEILSIPGVDEIHFGLNDLALSLGQPERFALLLSPLLERASEQVRDAGLPLGLAGIGRFDDTSLPIDPDLVYAALARLGATSTLLARSFVADQHGAGLARDVELARERLRYWATRPDQEIGRARAALGELVR